MTTSARDQPDALLAAIAVAEPADTGRAGTADSQLLLLLPAPAAAMPETTTCGVLAEEHPLPAVADAADCFSPDARHVLACPLLPSAPGTSHSVLPPAQRAACM